MLTSFLNKRDELCLLICEKEPDIFLIIAVITKAQNMPIAPALLVIPGYSPFTNFDLRDHDFGKRGCRGVAIYVADHVLAVQVEKV